MKLTDYKYQEKKEEEDMPVLKTLMSHQYNELETTYKSVEEDWLQPPEKILTIQGPTEWKLPENKNGKKNNSMDVLSD